MGDDGVVPRPTETLPGQQDVSVASVQAVFHASAFRSNSQHQGWEEGEALISGTIVKKC